MHHLCFPLVPRHVCVPCDSGWQNRGDGSWDGPNLVEPRLLLIHEPWGRARDDADLLVARPRIDLALAGTKACELAAAAQYYMHDLHAAVLTKRHDLLSVPRGLVRVVRRADTTSRQPSLGPRPGRAHLLVRVKNCWQLNGHPQAHSLSGSRGMFALLLHVRRMGPTRQILAGGDDTQQQCIIDLSAALTLGDEVLLTSTRERYL